MAGQFKSPFIPLYLVFRMGPFIRLPILTKMNHSKSFLFFLESWILSGASLLLLKIDH